MENATLVTLSRQVGLMREMQVVANNIANSSTTGFRREGVVFAEHVSRAGTAPSVSFGRGVARMVDISEGGLLRTGGTFDFAIRGEGFFLVDTDRGPRLTRGGAFSPDAGGVLRNPDGHALMDESGSPITIPAGVRDILMGRDGTLATDGQVLARVGLWRPADRLALRHEGGTLFEAGDPVPADGGTIVQGALEESNVDAIAEVARMIEVQRAYELGQAFLNREDERQRGMIRTIGG